MSRIGYNFSFLTKYVATFKIILKSMILKKYSIIIIQLKRNDSNVFKFLIKNRVLCFVYMYIHLKSINWMGWCKFQLHNLLLRYFSKIEFQIAHLLDHLKKLLAIKCFWHNWLSSVKLSEGVFSINKHKIWNK